MQLLTKARYDSGENERERRNRQLALEAACEGMVLLKNNGVLPFAVGKVALYGAGAIYTVKGGTGSGEVNERHSVNILQGLEDRGFTVTTKRWLQDYEAGFAAAKAAYEEEKKKRVSIFKLSSIMQMLFDNFRAPAGRAITEADVADSGTDCCIYVLSRQAGEGGDRRAEAGDWLLTEQEREHLRFCAAHYCRVLLCVNCGGMVDLAFAKEDDGIGAVLLMGQAGTEGGHALADVISGVVSPCGKLADSWPARYEDVPFGERFSYLGGSKTETYSEGIYVGYRYYDSFGVRPLWPFGYGMSYTDFSLRMCDMQLCGSELVLTAEVKNTGVAAGKEVAQLYVSAPAGRLHKEHQRLAAFGKTKLLQTGESEQLQLRAELESLASFDEEKGAFVLEAGEYILRLGTSSRHTQAVGVLTLPQEIAVSRHTAVCVPEEPIAELCAAARQQEALPQGLPRIAVEPAVFAADCCRHSGTEQRFDEKTEQLLQTLSVKEMAELVVGAGMFGAKTRFTLPGAVGNTTSRLWDRGIANIALCDGPAGLRVQKRSTEEKNGSVKPVDMAMSVFEAFPAFIKRFMQGDPDKRPVLYQYTTAFPAASLLAQSWNTALLQRVGQAVSDEMREYGCTYWLAPALNLHRNPLCGRNFEYYSEDPLLSGEMAAAVTRGVQQQAGCYVTLKHYCCNNREDDRNRCDSRLSQRALRELYLRGFEIAVRKGGAKGVMTAYNKVNGTYAANSHDLCTKVLRGEWGFDGVVMTDWFSTNAGQADSAQCIAAGNDLIMPGTGGSKRQILRAVKRGSLSEAQLRLCCGRVLQAVLQSETQRQYIG